MDELLGEGKEGAVYRQGHEVVKFFKPGVFSDETGARLIELVKAFRPPFPDGVCFGKEGAIWVARYPWFDSEQVDALDLDEVKEYLIAAGKLRVIADNFKMSNLRRQSGKLVYVDVGRHIRVLTGPHSVMSVPRPSFFFQEKVSNSSFPISGV